MKTWIGGQENLHDGDIVTEWSRTESGGVTLQVQRYDTDTAKAVLEYIRDTIGDDYFGTVISDHFGVES